MSIVTITSGLTTKLEGARKIATTPLFNPGRAIIFCLCSLVLDAVLASIALYFRIVVACARLYIYSPKYTLCTPAICLSTHKHFEATKEGDVSREGRTTPIRYASCLRFSGEATCNTSLAMQHRIYKSFTIESRGSKSMRFHKDALIFFFTTEAPSE